MLMDLKKNRDVLLDKIDKLKKIREVFHDRHFPSYFKKHIKDKVQYFLKELMDGFDLKYTAVDLTDDFIPILYIGTNKYNFDQVSGGERIAIALSLRLALTTVLYERPEMLMLDEPTVHLDSNKKEQLKILLMDRGNLARQLIIVTHDEVFDAAAQNTIRINIDPQTNTSRIYQE